MTQSQKTFVGTMSENVEKPLDDGKFNFGRSLKFSSMVGFSSIRSNFVSGIWKIERYGSRESDGWNEIRAKSSNMYLLFKVRVHMKA